MTPTAQFALLLWFPIVLLLFKVLPARTVVIISFIFALQFLPVTDIRVPFFPNYGKTSSTCYAVVAGIILFDFNRLKAFRLSWFDAPVIIRCVSPIFSSLNNDLGWYDGIVAALHPAMTFGVPYLIGRLYLGTLSGLKELAIAIFLAGLSYVPLCIYESRMSPQLHRMLYGFHPHADFGQAIRYGGYRPMVFMNHGLMLSLWVMVAAIVGFWLWRTGVVKKVFHIPAGWLVGLLMITVINNRSTGVWGLFVLGILLLLWAKWFRNAVIQQALIVFIVIYLVLSATHSFPTDAIVSIVSDVINPERAQSLEFRFDMEAPLVEKAFEKFWFGWGGWGRNRVYDIYGEDLSVTDSMWIITFGTTGIIGLASLMTALLFPTILFIWHFPPKTWTHKQIAPAAVLTLCLNLYVFDALLNGFYNPVYTLICGGLTGLAIKVLDGQRRAGISLEKSNHYFDQQYS